MILKKIILFPDRDQAYGPGRYQESPVSHVLSKQLGVAELFCFLSGLNAGGGVRAGPAVTAATRTRIRAAPPD